MHKLKTWFLFSNPSPRGGANPIKLYVAKHSYDPTLISPNNNYDEELSFIKGDYLYVFGEIDEVFQK